MAHNMFDPSQPARGTFNLDRFVPEFNDTASHIPAFDTLLATADSLQQQLSAGTLKSTTIVEEYQRAILKHNGYLNAVFELAPGATERAQYLDDLRSRGRVLGPLHGIPILLKDNINTDPSMGMRTTGGALALSDNRPAGNARVVDNLSQAGLIVMGKTTMSEMAFFKGRGLRCGWSALHGQSQSAYVYGGLDMNDSIGGHSSTSGSSSGSAIATSAGLTPLSLGSETFGSLVSPAARASLYTIKPTLGIVPGNGVLPISNKYDIAGPLAKSPRDVANLLSLLVDPAKANVPDGGYVSALGGSWKDIGVGTLDPEVWTSSSQFVKPVEEATKQIVEDTNAAYAKIKEVAKAFHPNVTSKTEAELMLDGKLAIESILAFGLEESLNDYLGSLHSSRVRSLRELVEWNSEHVDTALTAEYPNQDLLVLGLNDDHDPSKRQRLEEHLRSVGDRFTSLFDEYEVDVIIGPGDCGLFYYSAACGFPIASLPLSYLRFNGRPVGLTVAARPHQEATLIKVMSAWETTFAQHQPPQAFLEAAKSRL